MSINLVAYSMSMAGLSLVDIVIICALWWQGRKARLKLEAAKTMIEQLKLWSSVGVESIELRISMQGSVVAQGDSRSLFYVAKYGLPAADAAGFSTLLDTNVGLVIDVKPIMIRPGQSETPASLNPNACKFPDCQCNLNKPWPECCEAKTRKG